VHVPVCHGSEIDQQPEPVPGKEELQIHVLCFIFFFHEKQLAYAQRSVLTMP